MKASLAHFPIDALLRADFGAFVHKTFQTLNPGATFLNNWHLQAIGHHLNACRAGTIKRLVITMPPRSLKSVCSSVAFPAFLLGHDPAQRLICLSYAGDLAAKHSRDFRKVIGEAWYQRIFPGLLLSKETEMEIETTQGGLRFATSIGGALTGRGGDLIIVDDPLKPEEAMSQSSRERVNRFFGETLYSRLDNKAEGVIIVVMQRLHDDDLAGFVLRQQGWTHLNLPAIATTDQVIPVGNGRTYTRRAGEALHSAREPLEVLETMRMMIGSATFQAQYQQAPVPEQGNLIKREWIRFYDVPPPRDGARIVQSWDTAQKGDQIHDYSVCSTWLWRNNDHYLLDVIRFQEEYPHLIRRAVAAYSTHKPDVVLVEDQGSGTAMIQDLKANHGVSPIAFRPKADKVTRLWTVSALLEAGQVYLPRNAPWVPELLTELLSFPQARYDDQVDSLTLYLLWSRDRSVNLFEVHWD